MNSRRARALCFLALLVLVLVGASVRRALQRYGARELQPSGCDASQRASLCNSAGRSTPDAASGAGDSSETADSPLFAFDGSLALDGAQYLFPERVYALPVDAAKRRPLFVYFTGHLRTFPYTFKSANEKWMSSLDRPLFVVMHTWSQREHAQPTWWNPSANSSLFRWQPESITRTSTASGVRFEPFPTFKLLYAVLGNASLPPGSQVPSSSLPSSGAPLVSTLPRAGSQVWHAVVEDFDHVKSHSGRLRLARAQSPRPNGLGLDLGLGLEITSVFYYTLNAVHAFAKQAAQAHFRHPMPLNAVVVKLRPDISVSQLHLDFVERALFHNPNVFYGAVHDTAEWWKANHTSDIVFVTTRHVLDKIGQVDVVGLLEARASDAVKPESVLREVVRMANVEFRPLKARFRLWRTEGLFYDFPMRYTRDNGRK